MSVIAGMPRVTDDLFTATAGIGGHHNGRSTTDVWLTPPYVISDLGGAESFDLDPCAPENRLWDTAKAHFTATDNGLCQPWSGRVWLNPPYRRSEIGKWLARMAGHNCGVSLIFARTETQHFCRFVWEACEALLFLEGRLTFHLPDGRLASKNSGAPSVLCAYGVDDADVLAGSSLPGRFVPLRLAGFVAGYEKSGTWLQEIKRWMDGCDQPVHLSDLYRAFAQSPKAKRNPNYQAKIRQILQLGPFERVGRGLWETAS